MSDPTIEIIITEEDIAPLIPDTPVKPTLKERASHTAGQLGDQAKAGAKKAWQSETRKKATQGVGRGVKKVAKKGSQIVSDAVVKTAERQAREKATAVQQRIQETDWKEVAKESTATGLRWLSQKVAQVATRFTIKDEDGSTTEPDSSNNSP